MAVFNGPHTLTIEYVAGPGGRLEGETVQAVLYGDKGKSLIAVPDDGFKFVKWSDGSTEINRKDAVAKAGGINRIAAEFERVYRRFQYNYNGATAGNTEKETIIGLDDLGTKVLAVPKRENYMFEGWYSDWHHTMQVADKTGRVIAGEEWYNNDYYYTVYNPEGNLYAKWRTTEVIPVYRTLLVFVTEIQAELKGTDGSMVKVNYKMTETERQICELLTVRMGEYLNAIFNGTVRFEVDSYFTKEIFTSKDLKWGTASLGNKIFNDYFIVEEEIPEIQDILPHYQTILTTFCLNDWDFNLHITAGFAGAKYGNIHFESTLFSIRELGTPLLLRIWII